MQPAELTVGQSEHRYTSLSAVWDMVRGTVGGTVWGMVGGKFRDMGSRSTHKHTTGEPMYLAIICLN
jgi:hypothetical protein